MHGLRHACFRGMRPHSLSHSLSPLHQDPHGICGMSHAMGWRLHARLREWVHAASTCKVSFLSLSHVQLSQVRVWVQVLEHAVQEDACGSAAGFVSLGMVLGSQSCRMWVWVLNARAWPFSWALFSWAHVQVCVMEVAVQHEPVCGLDVRAPC